MAKKPTPTPKTFNPGALLQLLQDLERNAPALYSALAPIVSDLIAIITGGAKQATAKQLTCQPTDGCGCCLDCAKAKAVETLAAILCAQCCDDCPATP